MNSGLWKERPYFLDPPKKSTPQAFRRILPKLMLLFVMEMRGEHITSQQTNFGGSISCAALLNKSKHNHMINILSWFRMHQSRTFGNLFSVTTGYGKIFERGLEHAFSFPFNWSRSLTVYLITCLFIRFHLTALGRKPILQLHKSAQEISQNLTIHMKNISVGYGGVSHPLSSYWQRVS